jgi:hypothetical protein
MLRSPRRTIFGRFWGKSGQTSILARAGNDVNDPKRTRTPRSPKIVKARFPSFHPIVTMSIESALKYR